MGNKIFISYKYKDNDVEDLNEKGLFESVFNPTIVRDYVNELQDILDHELHIYKGEHDGDDLSDFADATIQTRLGEKIFDSSVTIVLISPKMREKWTPETDQWIPWEISYSLRETTRSGRRSTANAILALILPDRTGSYDYIIEDQCEECNDYILRSGVAFSIIENNRCNSKFENDDCDCGSYIETIIWDDFIENPEFWINQALLKRENIKNFNVRKTV